MRIATLALSGRRGRRRIGNAAVSELIEEPSMVTVKCTECRAVLELDAADLGRKVQCGSCQAVFTAEAMEGSEKKPPSRRDEDDRPSRRRNEEDRPSRRRNEEDRPARPRNDDDDDDRPSRRQRDDDDDDERPRRRSRRNRDDEDDGDAYEDAKRDVAGPATTMMVIAIIAIVLGILATIINLSQMCGPKVNGQDPAINAISGVIATIWAIIIAIGSYQMRTLKSRGWAMTAAIMGMIPCSGCCIITLPIGIWMLTVLNKPHVKDSFG